jgi:hypothetical protein
MPEVALARILVAELARYTQILTGEAIWPMPVDPDKLRENIAGQIARTYQAWVGTTPGVAGRTALFRACAIVGKNGPGPFIDGEADSEDARYRAVLAVFGSSRPAEAIGLWRARDEILDVVRAHHNQRGRGNRAKMTLASAKENLAKKLGYPANSESLRRAKSRSRKKG